MHFALSNEDSTLFRRTKSTLDRWWVKMALEDFIQTYRKKIGSYDIKPWERAMEASVRQKQSFTDLPKRPAKLKPELIDVDLVRGSTFPKEKSNFSWTFFTRDSVSRVVLLPLRRDWWTEQTSEPIFFLLLTLYFFQIFSLIVWSSGVSTAEEWISASETLTPLMLMLIVSEILTQAERPDQLSSAHTFQSVSDDASIDFDDLASLSDRSCRSNSPPPVEFSANRGRTFLDVFADRGRHFSDALAAEPGSRFWTNNKAGVKTRRKAKRRPSRSSGYGNEEVAQWQSKSTDIVYIEDVQLEEKESTGFQAPPPKRLSSQEGGETTDSGLFAISDATPVQPVLVVLRPGNVPRNVLPGADINDHARPLVEDCGTESDVSDMELNGWRAVVKKPVDDSTSDKEATDDDTLLQSPPPPIRHSMEYPQAVSGTVTDDDDLDLERDNAQSASEQPIGCTIWESRSLSFHKADLTVYEITNCIVKQAEENPVIGSSRLVLAVLPVVFALLPVCHGIFRTFHPGAHGPSLRKASLSHLIRLDGTWTDWALVVFKANGIVQRYFWGFWFFLLLAVAFETYQQRYLVAKYFGYLTSSRRAKRANLPHFRLSKVRNVKSWLCVRSCLKKYGPRKSVDVVVSFSCISCLFCVIFTCFMVVNSEDQFTSSIYVWEAMLWLLAVGVFLLRFMMLGSKTNQKFRNLSILTTEQLNLYLRMEQKPHKKDQLMLVNNVLKLAADLIKEIEHPCRISGFPANPFLYNVSRLLILSAFSTLISEICGFKLKLYKLKM